jgi:hypothetical protein
MLFPHALRMSCWRKILLVADVGELQDRRECQQYAPRIALQAAFDFAVGRVRTLQIAFTAARDDDDIVDP